MRFSAIPTRNLARRPARTLLTTLGIAVAVGSLVALVSLANGFGNAWLASLNERGTHLVGVQRGIVEILTSTLSESALGRLRGIEGVAAAHGSLLGLVPAEDDYTLLILGWADDDPQWRAVTYVEGGPPEAGDDSGVILGEVLSAALDKHAGQQITLLYQAFRIVGVARFGNAINNNMAIGRLPAIQRLLNRDGSLSLLHLRLTHPEDAASVAAVLERLQEAVPEASFTLTGDLAEQNQIVALLDAIAWATSAIALFMGVVIVTNTLLMGVAERTEEFGLLSAVGWSSGRILCMVLIEGLILGAIGGALGCIAGVGAAYWVAGLPVIGGFLEPQVTPMLLARVLLAVVLLGGIGGLYPAWRASRIQPAEALRHA